MSAVAKKETMNVVKQALKGNIYAYPSRSSPNAAKLIDGAIQRQSVQPDRDNLHYKGNVDKVGAYKREELNARASNSSTRHSCIHDSQMYRSKIARIYHPEKKHVHDTPRNKELGNYWVIEFESWGQWRHPLMHWGSASQDVMSKHQIKLPNLFTAVKYCEMMGWGYDILYPKYRWHTRKSYNDNFKWKGNPQEEEPYDF